MTLLHFKHCDDRCGQIQKRPADTVKFSKQKGLALPSLVVPKSSASETISIECNAVVIIGANGAGKSRFGVVMEGSQQKGIETHRISAQRVLKFADNISPKTIDESKTLVQCGSFVKREASWSDETFDNQIEHHRKHNRWGQNPTGHTLNDVDHVFSLLAAIERQENEVIAKKHRAAELRQDDHQESPVITTKRIWKSVMPHRDIDFRGDKIFASTPNAPEYLANQMSDGERVALYLIAQAVCASPNSILIIDEPEIHLHRSLQARLWDAIESARPDCVFVYITHNLDFAASREAAKKIWIKEYDGKQWAWEFVPDIADVPSALAMELLGGRKPILFVEGTSGSIDVQLYRTLYPDYPIVPRGSCQSVIQLTRAVRAAVGMHGMTAYGIIDRDRRSEQEIASLQSEGIFVLPVAEAENVLLLPCVLNSAASLMHKDPDDIVKKAAENILREFDKDKERQAAEFARHEAHYRLGCFDRKVRDRTTFEQAVMEFKSEVDPKKIFDEKLQLLNDAAVQSNYELVLRYFNRKGLVNDVSKVTGIDSQYFRDWTLRHILTNEGRQLLEDLRKALPKIPTIGTLPDMDDEHLNEEALPLNVPGVTSCA